MTEEMKHSQSDSSAPSGRLHPIVGLWRWLHEERPEIGDLIVCCAPHYNEGVIYFAGLVTEKHGMFDVMVTGAKGVDERSFIITHDTQWMRVNKPNV